MRLEWNPPQIPALTARHGYSASHAMAVHEGEIKTDGFELEGRPWVDVGLMEVDFAQMVADEYGARSTIAPNSFAADIELAFRKANEDLGVVFQFLLTDESWHWPRETRRQNGEIAGTTRDIYDRGDLYRSYSLVIF